MTPAADLEPDAAAAALADEVLAPDGVTREEMLEAVPLHVVIADTIDLDAPDPAYRPEEDRRVCIAVRRAGGRCMAVAPRGSVLCNAHSGVLDPRAGGMARAEKQRRGRRTAEEEARLARLGTRGLIADVLRRKAAQVERTMEVLLDAAALGDLQSAKLLIPYLNQGLGTPTERLEVQGDLTDGRALESLSTSELQALVVERRRLRAVPDVDEQAESA